MISRKEHHGYTILFFFHNKTSGLAVRPSSTDSNEPRTPGIWRAVASITIIAGSSPPVSTKWPTENGDKYRRVGRKPRLGVEHCFEEIAL